MCKRGEGKGEGGGGERGNVYCLGKSGSIFGPDENMIVGTNLILRNYTL